MRRPVSLVILLFLGRPWDEDLHGDTLRPKKVQLPEIQISYSASKRRKILQPVGGGGSGGPPPPPTPSEPPPPPRALFFLDGF